MIRNRLCVASFALFVFAIILLSFVVVDANAQGPGIKVKPILRKTLSGDDTKEIVISSAEFAPESKMPRHTHPGDDSTVVLQGALELVVEGGETRRVSAGEAFHVTRGLVHHTRALGDTPVRVIAVFVIDKGKKVVQPVKK